MHVYLLLKTSKSITLMSSAVRACIISGGIGYIGSHVMWHLRHLFDVLVVIDDLRGSVISKLELPELLLIQTDICDRSLPDFMAKKLLELGVESSVFLHLAADSSVPICNERPEHSYFNNLVGTINALSIAEKCAVGHFVFASSASVYKEVGLERFSENSQLGGVSAYGRTKLACEFLLEDWSNKSRIKTTVFRFFNVAGASSQHKVGELRENDDHLLPQIFSAIQMQKPFFIYGDDFETRDGTCIRDYIHVDDVAD